jgi:hypothetical protein
MLLQRERDLCKALPQRTANRIGHPGSDQRRAAIADAAGREYTFEELQNTLLGAAAIAKTQALLDATGSTREDWHSESARYLRSKRRVTLSLLQQMQTEIVKIVTERTVEIEVLHRRVCNQTMAKRFLGQINSWYKPLEKLVHDYNLEVDRYNEGLPAAEGDQLRHLSSQELRESGISHSDGEIWDVERLLSNADWACHKSVRVAIDAYFRQQRATEEKKMLLIHVQGICRWLSYQVGVLFHSLETPVPARSEPAESSGNGTGGRYRPAEKRNK